MCSTNISRGSAALNRPLDALRVYRAEIDRNPNDPGLYERLAAFLEQNGCRATWKTFTPRPSRSSPTAPGTTNWRAGICAGSNRPRSRRSAAKRSPFSTGSELERYFTEIVSADPSRRSAVPPVESLRARPVSRRSGVRAQSAGRILAAGNTRCRGVRTPAAPILVLRSATSLAVFRKPLRAGAPLSRARRDPGRKSRASTDGQLDQALAANPAAVQFCHGSGGVAVALRSGRSRGACARDGVSRTPDFAAKGSSLYRSLAAFDKRDTKSP